MGVRRLSPQKMRSENYVRALIGIACMASMLNGNATEGAILQWTRTSLRQFGTNTGALVSADGAFFVSDGFGIDRSTDRGLSWRDVTASASFAGGAIAQDPTNPSILIAGRSHGLLKSVDSGANWFALTDLNAGPAANAIVFDPQNPLNVFAGVGVGWGLYQSTNGGATWENTLRSREIRSVAVDPVDPQTIYAGAHVYGSYAGGVLKSLDAGASWTTVLSNAKVNRVLVSPSSSQTVFAATETDGIFRSTDGGSAWEQISKEAIVAPVSEIVFNPGNASELFASTRGQGVFFSPDAGETWSPANQGLTDLNVTAMDIQEGAPYAVLVATYGGNAFWAEAVPEPSALGLIGAAILYSAACVRGFR